MRNGQAIRVKPKEAIIDALSVGTSEQGTMPACSYYPVMYMLPFAHAYTHQKRLWLETDVTYIEYLRGLQFSCTKIASIMRISRAKAGIDRASTYSYSYY